MHFEMLLMTVFLADPADVFALKITPNEQQFDSFAEVLHVTQRSGTIDLSDQAVFTGIEFEFYRKGEKLETTLKTDPIQNQLSDARNDSIRFAVNIIDMDYLKLGDGQKNHSRLHLKLGVRGKTSSSTQDLPKGQFDLTKCNTSSYFDAEGGRKGKIPVFWMANSNNASFTIRSKVKDLITSNPKADLAIVYVSLSE